MTSRRDQRATVVIVTDRVLFPSARGTASRIIALVKALRESGYRVVIVARLAPGKFSAWLPAFRANAPLLRLADRVYWVRASSFASGSPLAFDTTPYAAALARAIRRERPIAVMVHYIWMAPCLDVVQDGILKVIDTLDLMHPRVSMYGGTSTGAWVDCSREAEAELVRKADVVIAIQEDERREFASMAPDRSVICVPHMVTVDCLEDPGTGRVVAFVGSAIEGNLDGLDRFVRTSWPRILAEVPDAEFRIYGEVVRRLGEMPDGVTKVGYVKDLREAHATADVIVSPVTLGTGLKIKAVEAMAFCRPVVSTSMGAAGLDEAAGRGLIVVDDFERLGDEVARLLSDAPERRRAGVAAGGFAAERFSPGAALTPLLKLLKSRSPSGH